MKMHELNAAELQEVNGGSLFGTDSSTSQSGLSGVLNIGNLLSSQSVSQNGDQASASSFSIGNGITSSLGSIFGQTQKTA